MTILTNAPDQKLPPEVYTTEARLPAVYETAKAALAECASIDECKGWSDKAAALASYAKMANDDALEKMATRIKARAIRRAGELLEQIDGRGGDRRSIKSTGTGTFGGNGQNTKSRGAPTFDRTHKDAAREAGLSKDQQIQAARLARIPRRDFETRIESSTPPTVARLAAQGTTRRPVVRHGAQDGHIPELDVIEREEFVRGELTPELRRRITRHLLRMMDHFDNYAVQYLPGGILPYRLEEDKVEQIREVIYRISGWTKGCLCGLDAIIELKTKEAEAREAGEGEALRDE